jgi:hypothetical protein
VRAAWLTVALAALLVLAAAAPASAATRRFQTPSHNIVCLYGSKGGPGPHLRCDVLSLNDTGFRLDRRHRGRRVRVTDTVNDPRAPVLRYGSSRRFGPFRCTSRRTGLTCRSRVSGHGFFLSRARQRVF